MAGAVARTGRGLRELRKFKPGTGLVLSRLLRAPYRWIATSDISCFGTHVNYASVSIPHIAISPDGSGSR